MHLLGTLSVLAIVPQAVFTLAYPPPDIRDPCQTVKCSPGFYCEVRPVICTFQGPCKLAPICVEEPPTHPGQCPKLTGLLECSNDCTRDSDCGRELKCCSHNCGRKCVKPQPIIPPGPEYPCNFVGCGPGLECRLRQEACPSKSCPVSAQCVPASLPPTKPRCTIGRPVLDENNEEWDCGNNTNSRHCPGNTVCNIKYGVCCFNDQTDPVPRTCDGFICPVGEECRVDRLFCITFPCPEPRPVCRPTNKIGSCPVNLPIQRKPCLARCTNDADCVGTLKCCGSCTRECTPAAPPLPKEKPGSCPAPLAGVVGPCLAKCGSDFECPGTQKCCGNCPRQCTSVEPSVPKEKPGSCPKPTGGLIGICIARCTYDSDCEGDKKCCGGCPRECVNPAPPAPKEKPGSCPKPIPGSIGPCIAKCSVDSDCIGDLKCCGNCPRQCTIVTPQVKPGFCPISPDSGSSICIKQCSDDYSCPRDSKCCVSGCRRTCKRLLPWAPYVDSDPCKRKLCGDKKVCKLQKVTCVRAPCYPTAICVDQSLDDTRSVCPSGYPVLDMNSKPLSCFNPCPDGTACVKQSCCWNKAVKPKPSTGSCPMVYGRRQRYLCRRSRRCQTDVTCPSGRKCCRVGRCGKRCLPVN